MKQIVQQPPASSLHPRIAEDVVGFPVAQQGATLGPSTPCERSRPDRAGIAPSGNVFAHYQAVAEIVGTDIPKVVCQLVHEHQSPSSFTIEIVLLLHSRVQDCF